MILQCLGRLLSKKKALDEAVAVFRTVIQKDPKNHEAYYLLAILYCRKSDFKKAQDVISAADSKDLWSTIDPRIRQLVVENTLETAEPGGGLFKEH